ncbi:hypothetical protein NE237_032763 [Protea cynaroides]|uniref:Uncharacterized protein n=1 Tax=Protea cynaroides TaxID=273540 RepID=A0A9Q0L427_9MAGN|nr:hypothetical protein NE237_032763 [Protea cynaroides]
MDIVEGKLTLLNSLLIITIDYWQITDRSSVLRLILLCFHGHFIWNLIKIAIIRYMYQREKSLILLEVLLRQNSWELLVVCSASWCQEEESDRVFNCNFPISCVGYLEQTEIFHSTAPSLRMRACDFWLQNAHLQHE